MVKDALTAVMLRTPQRSQWMSLASGTVHMTIG
jgi:hypothetical protein